MQRLQVTAGQEVPIVRFAYFRHLPNQEADVWHSDVFASSFPFVLNKLKYLHGNVYKERLVKVHYGLDISSPCTSSLYTNTSSVDAPWFHWINDEVWTVTANILSKYSRVSLQSGRPAEGINSSPQKCLCVMIYEGQSIKFDVLCYLKNTTGLIPRGRLSFMWLIKEANVWM